MIILDTKERLLAELIRLKRTSPKPEVADTQKGAAMNRVK